MTSTIRRLTRLRHWLTSTSRIIMAALVLALVSLDFVQVIMRYAFGTGWPWAGDVSIVMLLSLAWIGVGHLWLSRGHIAVDLLAGSKAALRRRIDMAACIVVIACCVVLLPMIDKTIGVYGFIDLPALGVSGAVKYWPIIIGTTYLLIGAVIDLALRLLDPDGGEGAARA
ncbi:TRAP transporter small permease [Pseudahrensia aquimaris]|uniref:TRAP transporter small permease protein n=1 Tax=Pseudahrensia aquimaris TaxID=744461 RepID=A0ABW3FD46_9HYPH